MKAHNRKKSEQTLIKENAYITKENEYVLNLFCLFVLKPHLARFKDYSWLCTEELILTVLGRQDRTPGTKPRSVACKANIPSTIICLQLQRAVLVYVSEKKNKKHLVESLEFSTYISSLSTNSNHLIFFFSQLFSFDL